MCAQDPPADHCELLLKKIKDQLISDAFSEAFCLELSKLLFAIGLHTPCDKTGQNSVNSCSFSTVASRS